MEQHGFFDIMRFEQSRIEVHVLRVRAALHLARLAGLRRLARLAAPLLASLVIALVVVITVVEPRPGGLRRDDTCLRLRGAGARITLNPERPSIVPIQAVRRGHAVRVRGEASGAFNRCIQPIRRVVRGPS